MGGNSIQDVIGKGNIRLRILVGDKEPIKIMFTNVLHVLGLVNNFF
jgi:hypothetical protein